MRKPIPILPPARPRERGKPFQRVRSIASPHRLVRERQDPSTCGRDRPRGERRAGEVSDSPADAKLSIRTLPLELSQPALGWEVVLRLREGERLHPPHLAAGGEKDH